MVAGAAQRGHTLIEVVCAFAVLTVIAAGAFAGDAGGVKALRDGLAETAAIHAASAHLERLRADPSRVDEGSREVPVSAAARERLPGVRARERVRRLDTDLFVVEVEVTWGASGPRRRSFDLATLIAREPR